MRLPKNPAKGQVRIIGGCWRGRKLHFSSVPGLRPTPDRVRETLFNWLAPEIVGAYCLDVFAGSGALGFEALSRGAHSVVMIDQSPVLIKELRQNAEILGASKQVQFYCASMPEIKLAEPNHFDIVFLDPPFYQNYLAICYQWLQTNHYLAPDALIYIEAESSLQSLPLPENWSIIRQKKAGQVGYYLIRHVPVIAKH
jgi:16S rRNA (guanine966-N2)-methyltransferase